MVCPIATWTALLLGRDRTGLLRLFRSDLHGMEERRQEHPTNVYRTAQGPAARVVGTARCGRHSLASWTRGTVRWQRLGDPRSGSRQTRSVSTREQVPSRGASVARHEVRPAYPHPRASPRVSRGFRPAVSESRACADASLSALALGAGECVHGRGGTCLRFP